MSEEIVMDIAEIMQLLPHRYPFLLVDRIIELEVDKRIVGLKNVTINEPFFTGHFPEKPVMPGVLVLEAMAQTAALLAKKSSTKAVDQIIYLTGASDFKWKKQVVPGDTLIIEMETVKKKSVLWVMQGKVTVNGKVVASGSVSAAVPQ